MKNDGLKNELRSNEDRRFWSQPFLEKQVYKIYLWEYPWKSVILLKRDEYT